MASDCEVSKRKLNDLRVIDLRAELESRGIDKSGVKAVLIEKLQQALEKEGHNPDEFLFDVNETPVKKNPKRTNKKLTRDDESETQSNVDETPTDLCDEDEKIDSDDDGIDEKFFRVLETTDGVEDAIDLSIEEEEEKLLNEEDEEEIVIEKDKAQEKDEAENADASQIADEKSTSSANTNWKAKNSGGKSEETSKEIAAKDASEQLNKSDDQSLIVSMDEGQNDLDAELSSPQRQPPTSNVESVEEEGSKGTPGSRKDGSEAKADKVSSVDEAKSSDDGANSKVAPVVKIEKAENDVSSGEMQDDSAATSKAKSATLSDSSSPTKELKPSDRLRAAKLISSGKSLWVTGLSSNTRATDLKALFSKYGKVVGAKIVSNARSTGTRCYGFVAMATVEDATKCIENLHRTELHGRTISVEKAKAEPVSSNKKIIAKPVIVVKKAPEKKEAVSPKDEEVSEKKENEENKEKESVKSEPAEKSEKEKTEDTMEEKDIDKELSKEEARKRSHRSVSGRSSRERSFREGYKPFFRDSRRPFRRPMLRRPYGIRPRNPLTFRRITDERLRQRSREFERQNREEERRRHQDIIRQREIERKQREEATRLERERERLRIEREKLERERAEVLRLEREKQRLERERIEREREELRKNRERLSRIEETRRPFKRPFDNQAGRESFDNRKRLNVGGPSRFISSGSFHNNNNDGGRRSEGFDRKSDHFDNVRRDVPRRDAPASDHDDRRQIDRGMRNDRFVSRDTDLRGHGRDDRGGPSYRDSNTSVHRPGGKDDWKNPTDRRGQHSGISDSYSSSGRQSDTRYVDRSSDTWQGGHGGGSQSDHRGEKSYSASGGIGSGPRDQWAGDRKVEGSSQSWGRSDGGVQGSRWGGINSSGRGQQSMGMSQSTMSQPSSVYSGPQSGSGSGGMMGGGGGGLGGGSFNSDRFDAYKSQSSMRRY